MKDEGNAGAALGPVRPVQGALLEEGLEEKRYRLEGQGTGKRGKHLGTDHGGRGVVAHAETQRRKE